MQFDAVLRILARLVTLEVPYFRPQVNRTSRYPLKPGFRFSCSPTSRIKYGCEDKGWITL